VTILGEFSPLGRLIRFGKFFFENHRYRQIAHIFWLFLPWKKLCVNVDENGLGSILGDFFINSSGQTALDDSLKFINQSMWDCFNLIMNRNQGDQMSLLKSRPKCRPTLFLPKLISYIC
jgi:hypothetical protein